MGHEVNHFSEPIGLSDGNQKPHLEDRLADQEASTVPPTATMLILSFVPIFLGLGFLYIVLGAWLATVGFTAVQAGLLISAQGIAVVLTSIPLGIISDIYGRKKLLILGNLAGAAALLVFALTTNFSYLISASVVLGFAEGASVTTWNALLADLTDNHNRNRPRPPWSLSSPAISGWPHKLYASQRDTPDTWPGELPQPLDVLCPTPEPSRDPQP